MLQKERFTTERYYGRHKIVELVNGEDGQKFIRKRSGPERLSKAVDAFFISKAALMLQNEYNCQILAESRYVPTVRNFYFGKHKNRLEAFMMMDFVQPGFPLNEYFIPSGQFTEKAPSINEEGAFKTLRDVTHALLIAHSAGVQHHDVKPENIIFGEKGGHLIDFGIAKIKGHDYTAKGLGLIYEFGTTHYLSPEQIKGIPRKETDIYQLGRTIYYVATMAKVDKKNQYSTEHPTEYKHPQPAEKVNPKIKEFKGLNDLLTATMDIMPENRPSLGCVLEELESLCKYFSATKNHGKLFGR